MKKVTINFIMSIAVVVLIFAIIVLSGVVSGSRSDRNNSSRYEVSTESEQEEIGDVEGYGKIVYGIGAVFSNVFTFFYKIMLVGYALLLLVFAAIARAVFSTQGKGLKAYRILMGIEYVLQGKLVLFCINSMSIVLVVFAVLVTVEIVYSARITYTERILE